MSILGSAFGRALSGAGRGAAEVANKYIDSNLQKQRDDALATLQRQRDESLADLQFRQTQRTEEYSQSPEVQARRNTNATAAATTVATAQRGIDLERLNDEPLNEAARKKATADAKAMSDAKTTDAIDAAYRMATDPKATEAQRVAAERKLAELKDEVRVRADGAERVARANRGPDTEDGLAKLPPAVKAAYAATQKQADRIDAAIVKAQADGMWEPATNKSQADLLVQQRVLNSRAMAMLAPYLPKSAATDEAAAIRALLLGESGGAKPAQPAKQDGKPAQDEPKADAPSKPMQLLQPLYDLNALRKRLQENSAGNNTVGP